MISSCYAAYIDSPSKWESDPTEYDMDLGFFRKAWLSTSEDAHPCSYYYQKNKETENGFTPTSIEYDDERGVLIVIGKQRGINRMVRKAYKIGSESPRYFNLNESAYSRRPATFIVSDIITDTMEGLPNIKMYLGMEIEEELKEEMMMQEMEGRLGDALGDAGFHNQDGVWHKADSNSHRREWTFLWKPVWEGFGNSVYASSLEGAKEEVLRQYPQGSSLYQRADLSTLTDDSVVNKRRWRDWDSQWNAETFNAQSYNGEWDNYRFRDSQTVFDEAGMSYGDANFGLINLNNSNHLKMDNRNQVTFMRFLEELKNEYDLNLDGFMFFDAIGNQYQIMDGDYNAEGFNSEDFQARNIEMAQLMHNRFVPAWKPSYRLSEDAERRNQQINNILHVLINNGNISSERMFYTMLTYMPTRQVDDLLTQLENAIETKNINYGKGEFGAEEFEATAYCKECNKEHYWEMGLNDDVCGLKCRDSECDGSYDNPEHKGYHINAKHGASTFPACYFGAKCENCGANPVAIVAYDDEPYHDEYCSKCWNTNNMVIEGAKQYYQAYNVIPAFAHEIKYMNRIAKKVLNAESGGAEEFGAEYEVLISDNNMDFGLLDSSFEDENVALEKAWKLSQDETEMFVYVRRNDGKVIRVFRPNLGRGAEEFGAEGKGYRNPYAFRKPKLVDTDNYNGHTEGHKNGSWDLYEMYGSDNKLQLEIRPLHDKWGITLPMSSVAVKDAKLIADAPMLLEEVKDGNRIKEYIYQFAQYPTIKKIHLDDLIAFIEEDDERFTHLDAEEFGADTPDEMDSKCGICGSWEECGCPSPYDDEDWLAQQRAMQYRPLKKDSCCCGATKAKPCVCMYEEIMECSATEPLCPCYSE